ncbi:hypothetical protein Efla_001425 [Eimeria flavescens]
MAEWGDRSQFATFALAAEKSASAVCLGAILGHGLCTTLAVVGGNMLAKRISERVVLVLGGHFLALLLIILCMTFTNGVSGRRSMRRSCEAKLAGKLHWMQTAQPRVKVEVLYETLCPFCKLYLAGQVAKTMRSDLGPWIDLHLYPYGELQLELQRESRVYLPKTGNAREKDGLVECQHGAEECRLNMLAACGLKKLNEDADRRLAFVECVEALPANKSEEWRICLKEAGKQKAAIAECFESEEGQTLLKSVGNLSKRFKYNYVPWVNVNGRHLSSSEANLAFAVCEALGPDRPHVCSSFSQIGVASFLAEHHRCFIDLMFADAADSGVVSAEVGGQLTRARAAASASHNEREEEEGNKWLLLSLSKLDSVHLLPCHIKYSGRAPVSERFLPLQEGKSDQTGSQLEALLHGRWLRGQQVTLCFEPAAKTRICGYVVSVQEESCNLGDLRRSLRGETDEEDKSEVVCLDGNEQPATGLALRPLAEFKKLCYWHQDREPAASDDVQQSLFLLKALAALHEYQDELDAS